MSKNLLLLNLTTTQLYLLSLSQTQRRFKKIRISTYFDIFQFHSDYLWYFIRFQKFQYISDYFEYFIGILTYFNALKFISSISLLHLKNFNEFQFISSISLYFKIFKVLLLISNTSCNSHLILLIHLTIRTCQVFQTGLY